MGRIRKIGACKICEKRGYTEWHHIISQYHSIRTGQEHLLQNPNNVIELCRRCHNQTTASMVRKRLLKEGVPMRIRSGRSRRARYRAPRLSDFGNQRTLKREYQGSPTIRKGRGARRGRGDSR